MNFVNRIKELYENKRDTSNIQNSNPNRKYSSTIKDRVSIFEKQIEELEQLRKNRNLFELTKKFGLQKFGNKDNSENKVFSTPKNIDVSNFIKEVEDICNDYEREIELLKRKNSALKPKTESVLENPESNGKSNNDIENIASCNNCYSNIKEIEEYKMKLKEKEEIIKTLTEENEELNKRFEDLNIHMDSMMSCLQIPIIADNPIISKENFSSNSNLESLKENFETNYLSQTNSNYMNLQYCSNLKDQNCKFIVKKKEINEEKLNEIKEMAQDRFSLLSEMSSTLIVEILSESLYNEYMLENSLNIYNLNKTLLSSNNLFTHINTIFLNESYKNMSISIHHEFIQNIFIHIYLSLLKSKSQKSSKNNKSENFWMITEEEINNEVVLMTVDEIFSLFYNLNNKGIIHPNKEHYFEITFEKKSYSKDNKIISLKNEIKSSFLKIIRIYEERIREDLYKIVRICRNYIHAGKIVYRNRIIFDFWKLYSEIKFCNTLNTENSSDHDYSNFPNYKYISNNRLTYSPSPEVSGNIDNLIGIIKYYFQDIDSINIIGNIKVEQLKEVIVIKNGIEIDIATPIDKIPINIIFIHLLCNCYLLKRIKAITLNNLRFTGHDLSYLNNIIEFAKSLETLNLNSNMVEDKGLRSISEVLKLNKSISSIFLAYNNITHNGAFYLAEALLKNDSISYIYLSGNNISGMGLQSLMNIIINENKSIKYLDLSNNKLTNNDIIIISNLIIKNCPHFEGLDISNNSLDSDSVNTLGLALRTNVFMKKIYLNNIGLNDDSTPYFFQHIIEANVEEINLDRNNLGEIGGVLFANVIKSNNSIKKISLRATKLNAISLICISHALEIELSKGIIKLESINLEGNEFDEQSLETLIKTFETFSKNKNNKSNLSYSQYNLKYPKISFSNDCLTDKSKAILKDSNLNCISII